jgi:hypothetical protein
MDIDLKRLRIDVKQMKARRVASPIGKIKTGATEIIRANFDELERMHYVDGATWPEIAAGLAAQGVTQGDGLSITGRRLTALMHHIRVRADKHKGSVAAAAPAKKTPEPVHKLGRDAKKTVSLSPEMSRQDTVNSPDKTISEDEIRRAELSKHAHLLGKR